MWNAQVAGIMTGDNGTVFSKAALMPAVQYVAKLVDYNAWNDTVQAQVSVQLMQTELMVITFCMPLPGSDMPTEVVGVTTHSGDSAKLNVQTADTTLSSHRSHDMVHC